MKIRHLQQSEGVGFEGATVQEIFFQLSGIFGRRQLFDCLSTVEIGRAQGTFYRRTGDERPLCRGTECSTGDGKRFSSCWIFLRSLIDIESVCR